jgi:CDP-diacylglycerol--glycerol-3-phosphate 3-phosphatidyltransferase
VTDAAPPSYGPSALATPANALTAARLLAAPVFVGLIATEGASWATVAVGIAVASSDGLDGWLARRQGATRSGAFLDPLADKVLVLGAFFALAAQGRMPWLPVGLMTAREVGMSGYRSWAGRRGVSVPARRLAKVKTIVQELAVATYLVPPLAGYRGLQLGVTWAATALTLASGAQYLWDGRGAMGGAGTTGLGTAVPAGSGEAAGGAQTPGAAGRTGPPAGKSAG